MEPPLALVCLARTANSFPVFDSCGEFAVSVLREDHTDLAMRFARKSADKFAGGEFVRTARGATVLDGAVAVVECTVHERYPAGDHIILLGEVQSVHVEEKGYRRSTWTAGSPPCARRRVPARPPPGGACPRMPAEAAGKAVSGPWHRRSARGGCPRGRRGGRSPPPCG